MNLTPEQREQVAKFAGYTIYYNRCGDDDFSELYYAVNENSKIGWPGDYTPDTNDSQHLELLKAYIKYQAPFPANNCAEFVLDPLKLCHAVLALLDNTENEHE